MAGKDNLVPFEKGNKLGNGRPKGSKNKATIMKEMLASKLDGDKTVQEVLISKLYAAVKKGDLKAISLVLDGAFGKDRQTIENVNIESKPIKVEFIKKDE